MKRSVRAAGIRRNRPGIVDCRRAVTCSLLWLYLTAGLSGCDQRIEERQTVDLLIENGRVIDPASRAIMGTALIAIDDGKIVQVGGESAGFDAAQRIDARGKTILPAFADLHVHWGNGTFAESDAIVKQTLARNLYYGVTRILNMGSNSASPQHIDDFRRKLGDGTWQGPKIYAVGALLTVPGSHPTSTIFPPDIQRQIAEQVATAPEQGPVDLMPLHAITLVRTEDDVRAEVRRLAVWGADAIKLTVESGPGPFGDHHPQMPEELVRAAVAEAHAEGIPVIAHISSRDELEVCLRSGVDAAAHAITDGPFDDALYEQFQTSPFFYIATLDLYDGFLNWSADPSRMQDAFLRETLTEREAGSMQHTGMIFAREGDYFGRAGLAPIMQHIDEAHAAGAVLLTGTDTGNPFAFPGYGIHQELRLLVDSGIEPMDALAAATVNAAKFFKEENEWGSIKAGQAADLLILDADPIADIMNTRKIHQVIQAGNIIDRQGLAIH